MKTTTEGIRKRLESLLMNFEAELRSDDLRKKVLVLIPVFSELRLLGKSLIPRELAASARDRLLHYFLKYPLTIIHSDELLVISVIQEYARRVRELRVQFGWMIASGLTVAEMIKEGENLPPGMDSMRPAEYIMLTTIQDKEAAYRWNRANQIRKAPGAVITKILMFLGENVGKNVTGEELRYVAGDKTEWARRVRELRTEHGWAVATCNGGRPDLPIGVYVLESDRQSPAHDRKISDDVRRLVLLRDNYHCTDCGWSHEEWNPSDPRHLESHHIHPHVKGGANDEQNLRTLCTSCHDKVHRK